MYIKYGKPNVPVYIDVVNSHNRITGKILISMSSD